MAKFNLNFAHFLIMWLRDIPKQMLCFSLWCKKKLDGLRAKVITFLTDEFEEKRVCWKIGLSFLGEKILRIEWICFVGGCWMLTFVNQSPEKSLAKKVNSTTFYTTHFDLSSTFYTYVSTPYLLNTIRRIV